MRRVRPGDILMLVRKRGPLFEAIIRALKERHVAVAGADRLALTQHIAVMDLDRRRARRCCCRRTT
jgi:ATP-dependent helicase/nuclease subunit A